MPVLPQFTLFLLRYYPSRRRSAPETAQFIIALEIIIWQGTTHCAVSALKVQCNATLAMQETDVMKNQIGLHNAGQVGERSSTQTTAMHCNVRASVQTNRNRYT